MSRSLQLSVPQPCHEDWAAMTPAIQGRHCAACAKTVVDFSRMTDAQVLAHLSQAKGRSCGMFQAEQLSRPLLVAPVTPAAHRWVTAAFAALGLGIAFPAAAQQLHPKNATQQTPVQRTIIMGDIAAAPSPVPHKHLVRGQVIDATTEQGLPGVTILVQGTTNGVSTAADGTYELELSAPELAHKLVFSSIGYEMVTELIGSANLLKPVAMKASCRLIGEVVVTKSYTSRGLWNWLTRSFRR